MVTLSLIKEEREEGGGNGETKREGQNPAGQEIGRAHV